MKRIIISLLLIFVAFPMLAQSKKDLKYEIYTLKKQVTEIEALKAENESLKSENQILKTKIEKFEFAEKNGFSAETSNDQVNKTENQEQAVKGQCKAITKAGTQCKRLASEGSDYCWQHQGAGTYKQEKNTKSSTSSSYKSTGSSSYSGSRTIHTGPRGGKYYINKNGNKTYLKH